MQTVDEIESVNPVQSYKNKKWPSKKKILAQLAKKSTTRKLAP